MEGQIFGDPTRRAVESLRGYAYQLYASAIAWMTLAQDGFLHLEVAEDFATLVGKRLNAVQVKATATSITLNSKPVLDTIDSFFDLKGWKDDLFVTSYQPQTRLMLCGRSIELTTTVQVARAAGYNVMQIDQPMDPRDFSAEIDEFSAVALLFHDLDRELPLLQSALTSKPFYIGALGSRRTHEKRSAALRKLGFGDADISRIKAPIGIFDKARDASSIALSVLADIAAAKACK